LAAACNLIGYELAPPFLATFEFFFIFFFGVMRMDLAFWENGCTTLPFFEACPYTLECEIFHSSWSLKISFFSNNFFAKIRVYLGLLPLDLHASCILVNTNNNHNTVLTFKKLQPKLSILLQSCHCFIDTHFKNNTRPIIFPHPHT
jgi:hypothetical protein